MRTACCIAAALTTVCSLGAARADDDHRTGALRLVDSIPIPSSLAALHGFDISWIDADTQRFYLADRSNKAIDVIDARTGTFLKAIPGGFAGVKFNAAGAANNDISGPNGVVTSGRWLFATDAPSRVVTIDLVHGAESPLRVEKRLTIEGGSVEARYRLIPRGGVAPGRDRGRAL